MTEPADQRVRRQSRTGDSERRNRRIRRIGIAMSGAGGVLLLAGLWLAVTAVMARSELNQVRADGRALAASISASDWPAARATATALSEHAHRAHQLTSGPVWALAAGLPSGGEPLKTIRGITAGVDTLGREVLPPLVSAGERLNPRTLRRRDGSVEVSRIRAAAPAVASASATVSQTTRTIEALPRHTWLKSVDASFAEALTQITAADAALRSADLAVKILPEMLGEKDPKRYFLAFQNEAEARGTGGLPGAFAIVEASHGKLRFARMESDTALFGIAADVRLGPGYDHLYRGAGPTTLFANSNISPHFPYAAQIWASMWRKYSGETVDGAIAVDPTALSYLLDVTGPATLPDRSKIDAANAVALTQSTSYAKFPGTSNAAVAERRRYLLAIASAASQKILDARGEPTALLQAAGKAAGERRLQVWSADPAVQANLAKTAVGGVVPVTTAPYVGLSIVNGGGNKLDYYLKRSLTWQRTGCGSTRRTTVTITLTNDAPATGLPPYVTGRIDKHSYPTKPGDSRLAVSYFATQGTRMNNITVAGRPARGRIGVELGHPVYAIDLELPRGASRTIVLHLTEPAAPGTPVVLRQPLVNPLDVTLKDATCT
jgi:Protein of unknown function (DUF4012)